MMVCLTGIFRSSSRNNTGGFLHASSELPRTVHCPSRSGSGRFHLATVAMFTIVSQETIPVVARMALFALPVDSVFLSETDTLYRPCGTCLNVVPVWTKRILRFVV